MGMIEGVLQGLRVCSLSPNLTEFADVIRALNF